MRIRFHLISWLLLSQLVGMLALSGNDIKDVKCSSSKLGILCNIKYGKFDVTYKGKSSKNLVLHYVKASLDHKNLALLNSNLDLIPKVILCEGSTLALNKKEGVFDFKIICKLDTIAYKSLINLKIKIKDKTYASLNTNQLLNKIVGNLDALPNSNSRDFSIDIYAMDIKISPLSSFKQSIFNALRYSKDDGFFNYLKINSEDEFNSFLATSYKAWKDVFLKLNLPYNFKSNIDPFMLAFNNMIESKNVGIQISLKSTKDSFKDSRSSLKDLFWQHKVKITEITK